MRIKPRRNGLTYDAMWRAAIAAGADRITITSYNEWQEGTQIEPAASSVPRGIAGYGSYDGAWGLRGLTAQTAYLEPDRLVGEAVPAADAGARRHARALSARGPGRRAGAARILATWPPAPSPRRSRSFRTR